MKRSIGLRFTQRCRARKLIIIFTPLLPSKEALWADIHYLGTLEYKRPSGTTRVKPFTANPVKALHFAIYWSNPPFLIFDIWALWRSGLSARAPECQTLKMVG